MVRILLRDAIVLKGRALEPVEGYVYIEDNRINYVGVGEVKEEHEMAELYITAKEKIVLPGTITPATWASLYPFRLLLLSGKVHHYELFQVLSRDDVYYASILAGYELLKHGVTTIGILDQVHQDQVIRALFDVGFRVLVLVDPYINNLLSTYNEWDNKDGRVKVYALVESSVDARKYSDIVGRDRVVAKPGRIIGGASVFIDPVSSVKPEQTIITSMLIDKWVNGCALALGLSLKYSMFNIARRLVLEGKTNSRDALIHVTMRGGEVMGLKDTGVVDKDYKADIVVLNTSEPPGWPPIPLDIDQFYDYILELDSRVETVIIDGEPVLDAGEPLNIGYEKVYKAKEKVSSIVEEYVKRVKEKK